jgi:hypothetical protein
MRRLDAIDARAILGFQRREVEWFAPPPGDVRFA